MHKVTLKRLMQAGCLSLLGIIAGGAAYFVFPGFELEENAGLAWLFQQRGVVSPASEVVIVALDSTSAKQLSLPKDPKSWPRHLHAELIDKLASAGAAVIVFDIFYKKPNDPEHDRALAQAIQQAGNVVLVASLQRELISITATSKVNDPEIIIDKLLPPATPFAQTAWALSPFVLPKVPARVNQFWTFYESMADTPTLPARALERYSLESLPALGSRLLTLHNDEAHALGHMLSNSPITKDTFITLRRLLLDHPDLAHNIMQTIKTDTTLAQHTKQRLLALLSMYQHEGRYYLNFYGPPHTVTTLSFSDVILNPLKHTLALADKVVFIGFSERLQPEQKDSYFTVFTGESGTDISGVEIAATAFTNLLHRNAIEPLSPAAYLGLVILFSLLTALLAWCLSAPVAIAAIGVLIVAYGFLCMHLFDTYSLWLPLTVPVFVQAPIILFAALVCQYVLSNRERKRIRRAFGYYLPDNVVNELANQGDHMSTSSREMFGICLATDGQNYTQLAETLSPKALSQLMNQYYGMLFAPVRTNGGVISDVVGDAMLAIWAASKTDYALRFNACKAALEIARAVDQFNSESTHPPLPTRIGLHAGQLMLGNIGALDHFEYRAVGDIVNTASRIEGLNKKLGSTILVSDDVLHGLAGFITRRLGTFKLAGKQHPTVIHEILAFEAERTPALTDLCSLFQIALTAYEDHQGPQALETFSTLLQKYPADAPSQFYYQLISSETGALPQPQKHIIDFDEK